MTTDLLLPLLGTGGQVDHHPRCEVHVLEQRHQVAMWTGAVRPQSTQLSRLFLRTAR